MTILAVVLFAATCALVIGHWWSYGARVGVVVTIYNEDPALLRECLDSLLLAAYQLAREYAGRHANVVACRQRVNKGKREALAFGFRRMAGLVDVFLCVDSDSSLESDAVYEGMRPFTDPRTNGATGLVLPSNHETNVLTRLQDVRYANAFLGERAAYSRFGSVLCICGILAFYRADVMLANLDDFLNQQFLGKKAVTGDDRRLTNYCLHTGRVVFAETAIAHTAVPDRFGHYVRQQARWGRSFFRESLWVLANFRPNRAAWWFTGMEIAHWLVFSTLLAYVVLVHPFITGRWLIVPYLVFVGLMSAARAVRYFDVRREEQTLTSRTLTFVVAPIYGYLNLLVMLPLRFYSLITLRQAAWGTRQQVEVTADDVPARTRAVAPVG